MYSCLATISLEIQCIGPHTRPLDSLFRGLHTLPLEWQDNGSLHMAIIMARYGTPFMATGIAKKVPPHVTKRMAVYFPSYVAYGIVRYVPP